MSHLGNLLEHWKSLQRTSKTQDVSTTYLQAAGRDYLKENLEMTGLTGLASILALFPALCDECGSLEAAVRAGHLACVQQLLEHAPDWAQSPETQDLSPLHLAVLNAGQKKHEVEIYENIAKILLFAKHDPARQNARGVTPLHWAAGYGRASLVSTTLHMAGTGAMAREAQRMNYSAEELAAIQALANIQDGDGRTALYRAVMRGHDEVVRWLVLMRADCNLADHKDHGPLHVAMPNCREELVRLLLQGGARADSPNAEGRLPLHVLAGAQVNKIQQLKVMELLCQSACGLAAMDHDGWTPVHEAVLAGNS